MKIVVVRVCRLLAQPSGPFTATGLVFALLPLMPSPLESIQPARSLLGCTGLASTEFSEEGREEAHGDLMITVWAP